MQQQQQQPGSYDLLAVFTDEEKADAASAKLRKEGFSLDEVFQLEEGMVGQGQFREHGPNQARSDYFLRTQKTGPKPIYIILFAVIFGAILGVLALVASSALPHILPEPTTLIVGALIGIILGASTGTFTRRRVRGAIGQDVTKQTASKEQPVRSSKGALNVVALRLPDSENISRKSRARAILLNSGGKIDRSVGRR